MNNLKKEDIIYLAGFIDGDGSIVAQIVPRTDYVFKHQIRITVQATQLTKRIHFLNDLKKIIGVGTVRTRGNISDFVLTETSEVVLLLKELAPYLRLKQKQANLSIRILEILNSAKKNRKKLSPQQFLDLCQIVDQVSLLNDSKNKLKADTVRNTFISLGFLENELD